MSDTYLKPGLVNDVRTAIAESMATDGPDEKPGAISSLPQVSIEDILDKASNILNEKAYNAVNNKVKSMVKIEEDGTVSQVRFLGKRVTPDNINTAIDIVCGHLNELAESGFIEGSLLPLAKMDLATEEVAVLSYVMLNEEGVKFFDENLSNVRIDEGSEISGV